MLGDISDPLHCLFFVCWLGCYGYYHSNLASARPGAVQWMCVLQPLSFLYSTQTNVRPCPFQSVQTWKLNNILALLTGPFCFGNKSIVVSSIIFHIWKERLVQGKTRVNLTEFVFRHFFAAMLKNLNLNSFSCLRSKPIVYGKQIMNLESLYFSWITFPP